MKTLKIYSLKDKDSQKYDTPFFALDHIQAKRRFIMAINNKDTMVSQFKNSFELVKIGTFDTETGTIKTTLEQEIILTGLEVHHLEEN